MFAVFNMQTACLAEDPVFDIQIELPLELREMLLERTGTKSIHLMDGLVMKTFDKHNILAVKAELRNWSDIESGIQEGIMHVVVAYVKNKETGKVKLYSIDFPIGNFLSMEKVDLNRGFNELNEVARQ